MAGFLMFVWFVTLIAFIVFWWQKRSARKAGGADYKTDPQYVRISKIKRIIGGVCILSIIFGIVAMPEQTPEEKAQIEAQRAQKAAQDKQNKEKQAIERVESLTGDDKNLFDIKFKEYMGSMDEVAAREKALAAVDDAIKAREDAAATEKKKQEEQDQLTRELSNGWDDAELVDNQKNFKKGARFVAEHEDYLRSASAGYPDLEAVLKKPWEYYGKVICISGPVGTVTQEPPGHSVSKLFDGKYFHTVIQGNFPVSIHIKGTADNIREGQNIRVRGLVVGQTGLKNRMGGTSNGTEFVGILEP